MAFLRRMPPGMDGICFRSRLGAMEANASDRGPGTVHGDEVLALDGGAREPGVETEAAAGEPSQTDRTGPLRHRILDRAVRRPSKSANRTVPEWLLIGSQAPFKPDTMLRRAIDLRIVVGKGREGSL